MPSILSTQDSRVERKEETGERKAFEGQKHKRKQNKIKNDKSYRI